MIYGANVYLLMMYGANVQYISLMNNGANVYQLDEQWCKCISAPTIYGANVPNL
jgi:hypothetical protein